MMIDKLCFTTCLNEGFIFGVMGTISSIRKFYSPEEADIVVFIDKKYNDFELFCSAHAVIVQYFSGIQSWVLEKIYSKEEFKNNQNHYYHPKFKPHDKIPYNVDEKREVGFHRIHHTHPLNVKAYCTGYCILIKDYKRVIHIDADAFLLSRIDEIFQKYTEEDTVIGFDDGNDELVNLEYLYGVKKPETWTKATYAFNAGVVFYMNGQNLKALMEDFCFYIDSCYHYSKSGSFADQGLLRALVAAHHIRGGIKFFRLPAENWNPTWARADDLVFNSSENIWINKRNNQKQHIWHGAGGEKLWTGKYKSTGVNQAWEWVGGTIVVNPNWRSVKGCLIPENVDFIVEQLHLFFGGKGINDINCLEIGTLFGRTSIGFCLEMIEKGYDFKIDTCDIFAPSSDFPQSFPTQQDVLRNISDFKLEKFITSHRVGINENLIKRFNNKKFNFIYIDGCHEYKQVIADIVIARELICAPGIIMGDDFNLGDVKDAVHTVIGRNKISVDHRNQWIYQHL